jgi:site-specific recombinase XerD
MRSPGEGGGTECRLVLGAATPRGLSPHRLVDRAGREIAEVNAFLDAQATRGLSLCSLRAYGYSLLNLWRWLSQAPRALEELQEPDLLDYIRFQRAMGTKTGKEPSAKTINHRLTAARCLYRFSFGHDLPRGTRAFPRRTHPYQSSVASPTGYLYPARARGLQLRMREARKLVFPLSPEDVGRFLEGLRAWRDLAMVALMLLCGLRSREIIGAALQDLAVSEGELRVRGKGGKERVVPLAPQVLSLLASYLEIERPREACERLFVVLKGPRRGRALSAAGLRSLFRHHRTTSGIAAAHPHRFRHTFGADMARAGISLPALMKLMGHADIHTTMIYVEISPRDVWEEFHRVTRNRARIPFATEQSAP